MVLPHSNNACEPRKARGFCVYVMYLTTYCVWQRVPALERNDYTERCLLYSKTVIGSVVDFSVIRINYLLQVFRILLCRMKILANFDKNTRD